MKQKWVVGVKGKDMRLITRVVEQSGSIAEDKELSMRGRDQPRYNVQNVYYLERDLC
jgi:hypothetical protein